ncbi:hypothetical protein K438DRAFT_524116 [Mycena galopus ATCC 62051]|nr:hypothetical protein K438DRAFT_524116 [Mycena galopus ATCC 62051]
MYSVMSLSAQSGRRLCPTCRSAYITDPILCHGTFKPQNEGFHYETCPNNTFERESPCRYFMWLPNEAGTIPQGSPSPARSASSPCLSQNCQLSGKPKARNAQCTWKSCKDCCINSQPSCRIPAHNSNTTSSIQPTQPAVEVFAGPYGRMVPPDYGLKLANKDFSISPSPSKGALHRQAARTTIKLRLWHEDGEPPIDFSICIPPNAFPWFHPKDYDEITEVLRGLPLERFALLSMPSHLLESTPKSEDQWVIHSHDIQVKADATLCICKLSVRVCKSLRKEKRPFNWNNGRDNISGSSASPSPTKKRRLQPLPVSYDHVFETDPSSSHQTIEPLDLTGLLRMPTPQKAQDDAVSYSPPASPTPRRKKLSKSTSEEEISFPLSYACNMDQLFTKLAALNTGTNEQKFAKVFAPLGLSYVSSTFSDNYRAWNYGNKDLIKAAVNAKYTLAGAWGPIVTEYKKAQRSLKHSTHRI